MEGLNVQGEAILARVNEKQCEISELDGGVYKHKRPDPTWPGGYTTLALIGMLSWPAKHIDQVLALLGENEHSKCLTRMRDVFIVSARAVFERQGLCLNGIKHCW